MDYGQDVMSPAIKIFICDTFNDPGVLREVECGVEEESVPCEVFRVPENNALSLSYAAALESVLEVGIGIDGSGVLAVHYKRLPLESPLFRISCAGEFNRIRSVCSNAARLVKGTPFILEQVD